MDLHLCPEGQRVCCSSQRWSVSLPRWVGLLLNPPLPSGLHCAFPTLPTLGRVWSPTLSTTFLVRPDGGARRRAEKSLGMWANSPSVCGSKEGLFSHRNPHSASGNLLQTLTGFLKNGSISLSVMSLCHLMDCSLPGFSVHGILQARTLEWVAIPFSRVSSWPRDQS